MGFVIALAIGAGLVVLYWQVDRKRYHGKSSAGARATGEVFRDPGSGEMMRVYEDPATGKREYRKETSGQA